MTDQLPQPFTRTDELLVAVHERLGEILDRLPPRQESAPTEGGPVEIQEPARESVTTVGSTPAGRKAAQSAAKKTTAPRKRS